MNKNLLSTIITSILICCSLQALPQASMYDTVTFDTPTDKIIIEASPDNIWQIGSPDKFFFNEARSIPNAIVTDTINSYPVNNVSSFIYTIHNTLTQDCYTSIEFWHKYDTDTLNDIGKLEASYDGGESWIMIKDTAVNEIMLWWDWDFHLTTGEVSPHNTLISGRSDGWIRSVFNWQWYIGIDRDTIIANPDSLMIKFTFTSDSVDNDKEGWMVDQIVASSGDWDRCSGINNIDPEMNITVFPNPVSYDATVRFNESISNGTLSLINSYGRQVMTMPFTGRETRFYKNNADPGLYFLQITKEGKFIGAKRIIIVN